MTSPPDASHKNVRVLPSNVKREAERTGRPPKPLVSSTGETTGTG